ncbi:DUF4864 domain-containing protein [Caenorhabditis elegans]|uniref:DUF4864 domain-containing protein n=1 Tax=Caenorhabditis elegans TaxID=6239 RepID=Q7YTS5_CAEEL|nr:DUF4864 domain-containing protein [Caenorhabditis elegans]CAE17693.1 DUF4864 domain-containing protein [Caenorhabditis elegans]|eukprot:NP_001024440.1 Uncharacterized protein CELE_C34E11.4 [Caenorhabditis elegans]
MFLILLIISLTQVISKPIYSNEIVENQMSAIKSAAESNNFSLLLKLVSPSVFELEDGERVRKAFFSAKLLLMDSKFERPGIVATVTESGKYTSQIRMKRSKESETGWILIAAGFLECMINNDSESFCLDD